MEWSKVEPVLKETYALLEDADEVGQDAVCNALGRPRQDTETVRALEQLFKAELIGGFMVDQTPAPVIIRATTKGLQQTSGWPREGGGSEQVELLLRLLDERIASEDTPEEEKGNLRRVRDAFAALGRDIAVGVLTAYAANASGASGN